MPASPRLLLATLLATALMLPLSAAPLTMAQAGAAPRLALDIDTFRTRPKQPFEAFDTVQMNAFDLNGDGAKEIIAKNDNNWIYVFDSRTGLILAELPDSVFPNWTYRELSGVAIGDVNGNGRWDLVSTSSAGFVTAWEFNPDNSTRLRFAFDQLWSKRLDPTLVEPDFREKNPWAKNLSTGFDGAAYLADVDGDGKDEVFVQADNLAGQYALRGDGSLLWGKTWDDGNGNPWVADIDRDGKLDAIFATDAGKVWVFDAKTGGWKWSFDVTKHGAAPGSISVAPGLIDLTGDGKLEVVFGTRIAVEDKADPEWYKKMHTMLFALSPSGNLLWKRQFDWSSPHVHMWPAAYDVDGDGKDDAVFMDWNTIGHKPGTWQSTGAPNLFALNGKGDLLFRKQVPADWSNKNIAVADVDGDGKQEFVVVETNHRLGFYNMTGGREGGLELPWSASRGPIVNDLHGDGRAFLVVAVEKKRNESNYRALDVGYREGRILVYDLGVAYNAAWDNTMLFNHGLDRLYGGKGAQSDAGAPKPAAEVDSVPAENFTVRVTSEKPVSAVEARGPGSDAWTPLVRNGTKWSGAITGLLAEVKVTFDDGTNMTQIVENRAMGSAPSPPPPTPETRVTPTPPPPRPSPAPPPPLPTPDPAPDEASETGRSTPGAGVAALVVALAAAAFIGRAGVRRG